MAMIVQHNITAMNASRMLGVTTGQQSKVSEKLSSGYRINRAADDAAGLSISEKMRSQIRGLDRASTNAQDGVSAVQTAEGALTEVHSMLQRMNELAVQSANGTNSEVDRDAIQAEIDQLVTEIDRVATSTKFNETYLLKGTDATREVTTTREEIPMSATYVNAVADTVGLQNGKTAPTWYLAGSSTAMSAQEILDSLELDENGAVVIKEGVAIHTAAAVTNTQYGAQLEATLVDDAAVQALYEKTTNALRKDSATGAFATDEDLESYFNDDGTYKGGLFAKDSAGAYKEVGAEQIADFVTVVAKQEATSTTNTENYKADLTLSLHVGADSSDDNKIEIAIKSMSSESIGVNGLDVSTAESATDAIDTIKAAIQQVSDQRSALGAVQNRLEHTIANLDNVVENTTAAESRIRDTDMAEAMVEYSKNNILAQAGQSMLAQANQSTQGVLSLLQ